MMLLPKFIEPQTKFASPAVVSASAALISSMKPKSWLLGSPAAGGSGAAIMTAVLPANH
jgi:hypothetical protein